ncbi:hypothetical protein BAE44_0022004 [Dichanthelium oligosanthes]|uniref:Uncharacterized protein n=1 Tax=Dichanthelium oligosanthes TaxID=888268 RepID=A0A1E5UVS5_9POAL|nr:hypothetical protein BAE44_0022004 [Dichanthelium oligosanthes]
MKPPAASPGRAEKPQLPAPAPPGLARLLLSKSRRGGRSRRAPATSPMFVSRGRSRAADGEPSSPKVTCIGQVRMRKGKKGKKVAAAAGKAAAPEKGGAKGYCRCLKKAFLCGGLFEFDSRKRRQKAPSPEAERGRRSPWVFSSRDVAVAAAPKAADPRSGSQGEGHHDEDEEEEMVVGMGVFGSIGREEGEKMGISVGSCDGEKEVDDDDEPEAQLVSSATTTPPKNALLLMRCRSAPQNRTSPLTSRFPAAAPSPSPTRDALAAVALEIAASPSPRKPEKASPSPSPSPRKPSMENLLADEDGDTRQGGAAAAQEQDPQLIGGQEEEEEQEEDDDEFEEDDEMRCSSARPLVLQRCKSEPATTAAAKMAAGPGAEATSAGCFWAHGGSSGRRRHAPAAAAAATAAPVALTGH